MQIIEYTESEIKFFTETSRPLPGDLVKSITHLINCYCFGIIISVNDGFYNVIWADPALF